MIMNSEQQYKIVCEPRLNRVESLAERQDKKINEMHAIITNGLTNRVKENHERLNRFDNRLWVLLSGVGLSIALQIMFFVMRGTL